MSFTAPFPVTSFTAAPVAFDAVAEIPDSLFDMFGCNACPGMLMAAITGIRRIVVRIGVAGATTRPMITVKPEITVVVERRRLPLLR